MRAKAYCCVFDARGDSFGGPKDLVNRHTYIHIFHTHILLPHSPSSSLSPTSTSLPPSGAFLTTVVTVYNIHKKCITRSALLLPRYFPPFPFVLWVDLLLLLLMLLLVVFSVCPVVCQGLGSWIVLFLFSSCFFRFRRSL